MIPGKIYKPEDILQMAWRRKWIILIPFVLASIGTVVYTHYLPDLYQSETLIMVVPQRVPESYVRPTVTTRIEDRLPSIQNQIVSRTRLERIIQEFNLYPEDRARGEMMEDVIERMRIIDIGVEIVRGDAFRVRYISTDPLLAMKVTERLASLFIEENLRDREGLAEGTNDFLESQLLDARRRLEQQELKLRQFRQAYAGQLPTQLESNMQALHHAEMQLQALIDSTTRDKDQRMMLQRLEADANMPEFAPPLPQGSQAIADPTALAGGTAAQQLATARMMLKTLELRYTAQHPDVVRLKKTILDLEQKAEIEALEQPLSPQKEGAPVTPAEMAKRNQQKSFELQLEMINLEIKRKEELQDRLRRSIAGFQARLEAVPARESEWIKLVRDYDTLKRLYESLLEKKEDSTIAFNLERRQIGQTFKVLDPARMPGKPFSPKRGRTNLMGAFFGFGLGVLLAGLFEYRDTAFRSDDDVVESLKLPVLAMIPVMTTKLERRALKRRRLVASVAGLVCLVLAIATLVWTFVVHG